MAVQAFLDSRVGDVVATTLHAVGAILLLGGLVGYLAWAHGLRHGLHRPDVLAASGSITILAVAANLVGGFMRTFQSGHPGLRDLPHEPWVQVMVAKHLLLFAGMGAAVFLFVSVAPRMLRAHREGGLGPQSGVDHQLGSLIVAVAIALAAVLGAWAQVTPIGHLDGMDPPDPAHEGPVPGTATYHNASGQITSTPLTPRTAGGTFTVAPGTDRVNATLLWSPTAFLLDLELLDPGGASAGAETVREDGRVAVAVEDPVPGVWRYRVTSDLALDAAWELSVRMVSGVVAGGALLSETVTIAPGSFFEINTEMEEGATFQWDWRIVEGTAVHFDVHSHFDDDVQYHVEMRASEHRGSFTNERAGGYSLLWANEGALPVTLEYRVWGSFEVDSYFPPR